MGLASLVFLSFLFSGVGVSYSSLRASYRKIIRIAYMNGYIHALQLDLEKIKEIRDDRSKLKEAVEKSADDYMENVYDMNK